MKTAVEWFYDEIKHIIPNDFLDVYETARVKEQQEKIEFACQVYDKYNFGTQEISFREECETFKEIAMNNGKSGKVKTPIHLMVDLLRNYDSKIVELFSKEIQEAKDLEMSYFAQAFEDGEHNYFYSKKTGEDFESGIEYYNEKFKQQEQ
jgi:hypothetical protein